MRELEPHEASRLVRLADVRAALVELAAERRQAISHYTLAQALDAILTAREACASDQPGKRHTFKCKECVNGPCYAITRVEYAPPRCVGYLFGTRDISKWRVDKDDEVRQMNESRKGGKHEHRSY